MHIIVPATLLLAFTACVETDPDPDVEEAEQAIIAGTLAATWMVESAAEPAYPCSATLVAPRYVLTALHCTKYNKAGTKVSFYTDASGFEPALTRTVTGVLIRPGTVTPPVVADDWLDVNGQYSDMALLRLDSNAPASSYPATLGWSYPDPGTTLIVVGNGNHDSAGTNDDGELRYALEVIESADDDDGNFTVDQSRTNAGDSGGPLYSFRKVIGVARGSDAYTSIPEHLHWILGQIGYGWSGYPAQVGRFSFGTQIDWFDEATEKMCQYACNHSPADTYNFSASTGTCALVKDVYATQVNSAWVSASEYQRAL